MGYAYSLGVGFGLFGVGFRVALIDRHMRIRPTPDDTDRALPYQTAVRYFNDIDPARTLGAYSVDGRANSLAFDACHLPPVLVARLVRGPPAGGTASGRPLRLRSVALSHPNGGGTA